MKTRAILFAVLAALAAIPAAAQVPQFPQTLQPNTVVGRLGIGPGPAQAIPFALLAPNLFNQPLAAPIQIGPLPWVQANVYAAGANLTSLLAVRGTIASPITDGQATAIFQSTGNQAANLPGVALYGSYVKRMTTNLAGGRAGWFEANDQVGGAGSFAEGIRGTSSCTGGTGGNCQGVIGVGIATVAYGGAGGGLNGFEGQTFNNSGTDATTAFSSLKFASPYLATNLGANKVDAAFITNPFSSVPFISGIYIAAGSVQDSVERSDATTVHGINYNLATCSTDCWLGPSASSQITGAGNARFGPLPFVQANNYAAGASLSGILAVRGTNASPVTDSQATAVFQSAHNSAAVDAGTTLYASLAKWNSGAGADSHTAYFEGVDHVGGGSHEGLIASSSCIGGTGGNCTGAAGVGVATVSYTYVTGVEGQAWNNSGTDATTAFSSLKFATPMLSSCRGTNKCDAAFLVNPNGVVASINGLYVAAAAVTDSVIRSDAATVHGINFASASFTTDIITAPNFLVDKNGVITATSLIDGAGTLVIGSSTGALKLGGSGMFTANGAVATAMSSLGPAGSHTTIQEWFTVQDPAGTIRYIPAF
jgi:hypothetical protein